LEGIDVIACERAYVLDVEHKTVRVVGDNLNRKYGPLTKYEVPCTMDVVGRIPALDNVPCELDYKSGRSIGKIEDHWQRRVCAAVLMIHYDSPTSIGRVGYIWEDGRVFPDGGEFSCLDIDDWCDAIKAGIDKVEAAKALLAQQIMPPVQAEEDDCKYCPALTSCPHHMNFVRSLLGQLVEIEKGPNLNVVPLEDIGRAFDLFKKAEKILKIIEKAGKLAGAETPLPIDDKYEYVTRWQDGKASFDGAKARGEIVKLMGQAGASEEEIAAKLASLNGKGPDFPVFNRVKRVLPVVKQEQELKAS